jgi:hypothetical protein
LNRALEELKVLRQSQPILTSNESENPFTECATFADDIKPTYKF